jgi:2-polyprenyl-3-methyl-5-hydroxy-6-metoxy-1,4-benzoquinol methylase
MSAEYKEYGWEAGEAHMQARILQGVLSLACGQTKEECKTQNEKLSENKRGTLHQVNALERLRSKRVLDVGCGNGFMCGQFLKLGCEVTGVDLSEQGVARARESFPAGRFEVVSAGDDLLEQLREEPFDIVISTEVVEHLYSPREWARACFTALRPGGRFVCTTPYHGYLKNLAISLAGKWDGHASPLWDGGHIKLWSKRTLFALLQEAGFRDLEFRGIGRVPGLWMTMAVAAVKPRAMSDV